ncbi:MAG: U32 family peptidase [Clostridia bacterium]|nr:U32 family peptidase [Clostridia bacterium]
MTEILAPAGNVQCARAAIHAGADAIYLGYSAFSARQSAENFDVESLRDIVFYAHLFGVKVYLAMNTLVKDEEIPSFLSIFQTVCGVGIDAVILQDALLGKAVHKASPGVVLHLSTQAGVCNENGAIFAKECGFSRVILARETPLDEIVKIAKIIETETFVQGALCTCFSGQCYFSSFIGGNSGNRGRCKQPCRKRYSYNRVGFEEPSYALSLSDLCVGEEIQKLVNAGVVSFKIEGRMRRAEYVSAAVSYYRAILDGDLDKEKQQALSALKRTYNRGNYTKGLTFGQDKRFLSTAVQGHIGEKVGVVKVINGKYVVDGFFRPSEGDAFKILRDGKEVGGATFEKCQAKGFTIRSQSRLRNGDSVFITTDTALNAALLSKEKRATLYVQGYFHENEYAIVESGEITVRSETPLQSADARPLTVEEVRACFAKTDGLPVDIVFTTLSMQGSVFIPKSQLNALRRSFFDALRQSLTKSACITCGELSQPISTAGKNEKTAVISSNFAGVACDVAIWKVDDFQQKPDETFIQSTFEKYVYYPPFCTSQDEEVLAGYIQKYHLDGVYAENYSALIFAKKYNVKTFAGTGLHLFNRYALSELLHGYDVSYYAVSKETTLKEQRALMGEKAFALTLGNIKLMDLCYCPFGKTCKSCDRKQIYTLTDENGREFPVRRYRSANGDCRFEVYNCADLIGKTQGVGTLIDVTVAKDKSLIIAAKSDIDKQKDTCKQYTSGHSLRGVL